VILLLTAYTTEHFYHFSAKKTHTQMAQQQESKTSLLLCQVGNRYPKKKTKKISDLISGGKKSHVQIQENVSD